MLQSYAFFIEKSVCYRIKRSSLFIYYTNRQLDNDVVIGGYADCKVRKKQRRIKYALKNLAIYGEMNIFASTYLRNLGVDMDLTAR